MAEKKTKVISPELASEIETADKKLAIRKQISPDGYAICGKCGVRVVNVEARIRCKYCWNCGTPIRWR